MRNVFTANSVSTVSTVALVVSLAACATAVVPNELVSARSAYDRAAQGPATRLDPADLHAAKETLDAAEKAFVDNGDTQETRDIAYTAERRTEIAESRARAADSEQRRAAAVAQLNASQTDTVRGTSAALGRANQQIAAQGRQIQTERQRGDEAEKRAKQAAADLARIASVKQEARGMVITLSGGVLFASSKSDLLPSAQLKLNDVAKALSEQDPNSKLIVEGHTDSQGGEAFNQELSRKRAESVRAYLVGHGIAADRVTAQGYGPSRSIADNGSAEGRANNRRVEIVVQPAIEK